jgi:hypothetical protein
MKTGYSLFKFNSINNVLPFVKAVILFMVLFFITGAKAQQTIRYYSEKNKDTYIGFSGTLQVWARYTELNPGSTINGNSRNTAFDISVRRYRVQMYAQLASKTRFTLQVGNNNLNYNTASGSPKILDAYVDHQISNAFALGIGKNGWTGLSRYASPSSGAALDFDINYSATAFVNINDSFLRRMGIYARGQFNRFDYRIVFSKPYAAPVSNIVLSERAIFANGAPDYQTSAYLKYQFRDQETQTPFSPGTYLGEKEIFNIGIGALYQPHSTMNMVNNDTVYHAAKMLAIDVFYETSFNSQNTVTIYGSYLKNLLGPLFIRNIGANNPSDIKSVACFNGGGNSMPVTGTGNIFNAQFAYLKSVKIGEKIYKVQAFSSMEYGKLDALHDPLFIYDVGLNYFIKGHSSKITIGYQNRPVYFNSENKIISKERKSMIVIQYQIKIG